MLTTLFVLVRILANPLSNVCQKHLTQRGAHPIIIITGVHAALTIVCVPWLVSARWDVAPGVWANMSIAALLAVTGNVLLVYALSETDLSILGPINAYKSVVSLVLGIFLIGERPSRAGLLGVLLIAAGSYFVIDRSGEPSRTGSRRVTNAFVSFFSARGVRLRFAALFFSAAEAVFLKRAILLSSPWPVFVLWCGLGFLVAMVATFILVRGQITPQLPVVRSAIRFFIAVVITTGLMQMATLVTFRELQVGYSLALFQLSAIVSVLLGHRYFAESNIGERLLGSVVMAAGAALIVIFGRQT